VVNLSCNDSLWNAHTSLRGLKRIMVSWFVFSKHDASHSPIEFSIAFEIHISKGLWVGFMGGFSILVFGDRTGSRHEWP
jgi:hypothetical protein